MLSASLLGEKSATIQVIEAALVQSVLHLPEIAPPLQSLHLLAKQGHTDAMLLHGRVLLQQGEDGEALEWFHQAAEAGETFDGLGEALTQEGQILMKRRDKVGAVKLLRRAALELDEPVAYWLLSGLQPKGSPEQELYLLKAASSGVTQAAHDLGVVEMRKLDNRPRQGLDPELSKNFPGAQFSLKELGIATEWFEVAAAGGHGQSMLTLAMLCQANGRHEEGLKWLEKAQELVDPETRKGARGMRDRWDDLGKLHLMKPA
jgi:TPR repeat protein